jgi:very-short-patch-repair endonuclease
VTEAQQLLQIHLAELGIGTVAEYRFDAERKFRFDLASLEHRLGFECNGTFGGLHGPRWSSSDAEKMNLAQLQGWRVLVFTNKQVLSGEAKAFLKEHLEIK